MIGKSTGVVLLITALIAMTVILGGAVVTLELGLAEADNDADEQVLAYAQSDQLVTANSPITVRDHVINKQALQTVTAEQLQVGEQTNIAIRLNGTTYYQQGDPADGTTVRRIVLVTTAASVSDTGQRIDLPRGVGTVTVTAGNAKTIRANGRVVATDSTGVRTATIPVSHRRPTTLRTDRGYLTATYRQPEQEPAILSVTVARDRTGAK